MLGDALRSGDTADVTYDKDSGEVKFHKVASASKPAKDKPKAGNGHDAQPDGDAQTPLADSASSKGRKKRGSTESGKHTR